jgi:hypothetical protein
MKYFITITLTLLVSYLSGAILPWWCTFPLVAIIYALLRLSPGYSFLFGFASLFLLWGTVALVMDVANHHLLSKKISVLFMQNERYGFLILITAFIGGLVGGLSALTGSLARRLFFKIQ